MQHYAPSSLRLFKYLLPSSHTHVISLLQERSIMTGPHPIPILKRDCEKLSELHLEDTSNPLPFATCQRVASPHVHFPPTPRISSMHLAYSPQTYDRAPIAVSPNACQLPSRGERTLRSPPAHLDVERRGRSRSRGRNSSSSSEDEDLKGSYFHPRAYEACKPEPPCTPSMVFEIPCPPTLLADLSPSEESDESIVTPPSVHDASLAMIRSQTRLLHAPRRQSSMGANAVELIPRSIQFYTFTATE